LILHTQDLPVGWKFILLYHTNRILSSYFFGRANKFLSGSRDFQHVFYRNM